MNNKLQSSIQYLRGVGPALAKTLSKLKIYSIEDLIYYFPYEYEDRRQVAPIGSIKLPAEKVILKGEVISVDNQNTKGGYSVLKVIIGDKSGTIRIIFFNQQFLSRLFRPGMKIIVSGKAEMNFYEGGIQILPKDWEIDTGTPVPIVPIYHLTDSLYAKTLRKIIRTALDEYLDSFTDAIPKNILTKFSLPALKDAIQTLHFPKDFNLLPSCKKRIIFDDLFTFQIGLGLKRKETRQEKGIPLKTSKEMTDEFQIPFNLTSAQERVLAEIAGDLRKSSPMKRLLQGDVGSGKTIIAALACYCAIKNGFQAAIMAPTEILAQQHFDKLKDLFKEFSVKLLTGTTQKKEKKLILDENLIIGTHALIEGNVKFKKLGLAVIDEQHRFGVLQRSALESKGLKPHMLFMTATPIPRSLALTLYGDLDRSIIDEMPPGRTPIKTHYVPNNKRKSSYDFMRKKIQDGQQVFIVCPLVLESETLDLKAATDEAVYLQNEVFPEFAVGLVHGKMKPMDKDKVMAQFRDKKIQVLVSTTVIEVGIDIPNASIMVIEHSERFGLSQLHQLRGRVGRGLSESYCFLMGEPKTQEAKTRIKAMLDTNDGFMIAEVDLKLRGPGDFYGVKQSGLPEFRMADIIRDEDTLRTARDEAFKYLETDPNLASAGELKATVLKLYGKFLGY